MLLLISPKWCWLKCDSQRSAAKKLLAVSAVIFCCTSHSIYPFANNKNVEHVFRLFLSFIFNELSFPLLFNNCFQLFFVFYLHLNISRLSLLLLSNFRCSCHSHLFSLDSMRLKEKKRQHRRAKMFLYHHVIGYGNSLFLFTHFARLHSYMT